MSVKHFEMHTIFVSKLNMSFMGPCNYLKNDKLMKLIKLGWNYKE